MRQSGLITALALTLFSYSSLHAFCGFYVAKADADLFNRSSEVIISRNNNNTVITMSNDFDGNIEDFAIVVPVPQILKENDIRVVDHSIFDHLDAYSGPRLVEYHDQNPCERIMYYDMAVAESSVRKSALADWEDVPEDEYKVTIEAEYTVGEYDIIILSAADSDGLERWLTDNGYRIPEKASSVLKPYIRSDMKFFVVKVNLENQKTSGYETLRPLQIEFESNKFMLPIRLGMANADGYQDLIVYILSQKGRVETANYRTIKVPTDKNIPEFVVDDFGGFYKSMFDQSYENEYRNAVFMEYAWDLSSNNFVKCDPCAFTPPALADLQKAGANWLSANYRNAGGGSDYVGDVFFTRLHVRYDRANFPQDLFFTETPNKESFQGRYIMTHAAKGIIDCDGALGYLQSVLDRRKKEVKEFQDLTGTNTNEFDYYVKEYQVKVDRLNRKQNTNKGSFGIAFLLLALLTAISIRLESSAKQ